MSNIKLGLLAAFLLGLLCTSDKANATTGRMLVCMKGESLKKCRPPFDARPTVVGAQAKRELMRDIEYKSKWHFKSATVIDFRNSWFRVVHVPNWEQHLVSEVDYCAVEINEYSDGLSRPAESTRYYFLRIDKHECQQDNLVQKALSYAPFDEYNGKRTICDVNDLQQCMAAVELIGRLAERIERSTDDDRGVELIGYPSHTNVPDWLVGLLKQNELPDIFVSEYGSTFKAFCARYGTVALICGVGDDPVTFKVFPLKHY